MTFFGDTNDDILGATQMNILGDTQMIFFGGEHDLFVGEMTFVERQAHSPREARGKFALDRTEIFSETIWEQVL